VLHLADHDPNGIDMSRATPSRWIVTFPSQRHGIRSVANADPLVAFEYGVSLRRASAMPAPIQ
jgi:hypothetical protein